MDKAYFADNTRHRLLDEILGEYGYRRVSQEKAHQLYFPAIVPGFKEAIETLQLAPGQALACISGYYALLSKRALFVYLMRHMGLQGFDVVPPTFMLDGEANQAYLLEHHRPGDVYLLKKNMQSRQGIDLVHDLHSLTQYSQQDGYAVVQKLIPDVFQLDHRKFHLRLYLMLEAFQGHVKAYCHDEGVLQYAAPYSDPPTFENSVNTQHLYAHESNLPFTYTQLCDTLMPHGYDLRALRPTMEQQMIHCLEAVKHRLGQSESLKPHQCFQLYGVDFVFTFEMKSYLLEFSFNPLMEPREARDHVLKTQIYKDFYQQLGFIERPVKPALTLLWENN